MPESQSDHDLLIALHEQMKGVRDDIKEIKDGVKSSIDDHERRIRRLELWGAIAVGGLYVIGFYLQFIK